MSVHRILPLLLFSALFSLLTAQEAIVLENNPLKVSIYPEQGGFEVLDKRVNILWKAFYTDTNAEPWRMATHSRRQASFVTTFHVGDASFPAIIRCELPERKSDELVITLEATAAQKLPSEFKPFGGLCPAQPEGEILAPVNGNGLGIPVKDLAWRGTRWRSSELAMPWVAVTAEDKGYLLLFDLPSTCDSSQVCLESYVVDGKELLVPVPVYEPMGGAFGAARTLRYVFTADGGHVALCKRYRDFAAKAGVWVPQREKLKRLPALKALAGAPMIWGESSLSFCQEAHAAGIRRMILNGHPAAEDLKAIHDLGYLVCAHDAVDRAGGIQAPKADSIRPPAWFVDAMANPPMERSNDIPLQNPTQARQKACELMQGINNQGVMIICSQGKWWGVPFCSVSEGLQSGAFRTVDALAATPSATLRREQLDAVLAWGMNHTRRYPLWELVFHDCQISTWARDDGTARLHQLVPDLEAMKNAFNVLYGTVPLHWLNVPGGYAWRRPEEMGRLLDSYRVTGLLHEQVGFSEMRSHEFVTANRDVQKTTFGDGTQVWVNFGEAVWPLNTEGLQCRLPQYGFFAQGPDFLLCRLCSADGQRVQTFIRKDGYAFADHSREDFAIMQKEIPLTAIVEDGPAIRLIAEGNPGAVDVNLRTLCPKSDRGQWHVLRETADGQSRWLCSLEPLPNGMLRIAGGLLAAKGTLRLLSPKAMERMQDVAIPSFKLVMGGVRKNWLETAARQPHPHGPLLAPKQTVGLEFAIRNQLDHKTGRCQLAVVLQSVTRPADRQILHRDTLKLNAHDVQNHSIDIVLPETSGLYRLVTTVTAKNDMSPDNNQVEVPLNIVPASEDYKRIPFAMKRPFAVNAVHPVIALPFDSQAVAEILDFHRGIAVDDMVVTYYNAGEQGMAAAQWVAGQGVVQDADGQLAYDSSGEQIVIAFDDEFPADTVLQGTLWLRERRREEPSATLPPPNPDMSFAMAGYHVSFRQGAIQRLSMERGARHVPILDSLQATDGKAGQLREDGVLESMEILAWGPALIRLRVRKTCGDGQRYDKVYDFHPHAFTVTTLTPAFGCMDCAVCSGNGEFIDDAGRHAVINGDGGEEGIAGPCQSPLWSCILGDEFALFAVPLTPMDRLEYRDVPDALGCVGYVGSGPCRMHFQLTPRPSTLRLPLEAIKIRANLALEADWK